MLLKHTKLALAGLFMIAAVSPALAQSDADTEGAARTLPPPPVPADAPDHAAIPLGAVAGDQAQWENFLDQLTVRNVTAAELYPVLPGPGRANGKAVIVVPGGGYTFVSVENEGFPVAERLAAEGYVAFVLKYRTRETPEAADAFLALVAERASQMGTVDLEAYEPAVSDLAAAMAYVSQHCPDYGCAADDGNLIGFSAGALSVIRMLEAPLQDVAIASAALVYPPLTHTVRAVTKPPLFLAVASDDPFFRQGGFTLPQAWYRATGQLEFHLYERGGHGFGTLRKGATTERWLDQYVAWLSVQPAEDG